MIVVSSLKKWSTVLCLFLVQWNPFSELYRGLKHALDGWLWSPSILMTRTVLFSVVTGEKNFGIFAVLLFPRRVQVFSCASTPFSDVLFLLCLLSFSLPFLFRGIGDMLSCEFSPPPFLILPTVAGGARVQIHPWRHWGPPELAQRAQRERGPHRARLPLPALLLRGHTLRRRHQTPGLPAWSAVRELPRPAGHPPRDTRVAARRRRGPRRGAGAASGPRRPLLAPTPHLLLLLPQQQSTLIRGLKNKNSMINEDEKFLHRQRGPHWWWWMARAHRWTLFFLHSFCFSSADVSSFDSDRPRSRRTTPPCEKTPACRAAMNVCRVCSPSSSLSFSLSSWFFLWLLPITSSSLESPIHFLSLENRADPWFTLIILSLTNLVCVGSLLSRLIVGVGWWIFFYILRFFFQISGHAFFFLFFLSFWIYITSSLYLLPISSMIRHHLPELRSRGAGVRSCSFWTRI